MGEELIGVAAILPAVYRDRFPRRQLLHRLLDHHIVTRSIVQMLQYPLYPLALIISYL